MLVLRECLHRTLEERMGSFAVLRGAANAVGVVYPGPLIMAEFLIVALKRSPAFWSHAARCLAETFDRGISYLSLASWNIDTSQFFMDALSLVILAGPLENLTSVLHGFYI